MGGDTTLQDGGCLNFSRSPESWELDGEGRPERCIQMNAAQHISGVSNMIADSKSRLDGDRFDWMLACNVFLKINQILSPVEVDLFASRLTHQLPQFFRPTGRGNGCFPTRLKQGEGLCQSPLVPDRPCPQQSQGLTGSDDPGSPSLEVRSGTQ